MHFEKKKKGGPNKLNDDVCELLQAIQRTGSSLGATDSL
jgi:hypothetical protein